jgi:sialate O-acetylesterase
VIGQHSRPALSKGKRATDFPALPAGGCRPAVPAGKAFPGSRRSRVISLVSVGLLACGLANAQLELPGIFASNMVVQRGQPVRVWGTGAPGARVEVTLGPRSGTATTDAEGGWQVALEPVAAGGPYTLAIASGGAAKTLTNVLCGDVWLCSGQSNMQLPVKEVDPLEQKAELAERPNVRLCSVPKVPSAKPLSSAGIRWQVCTPAAAREFSAVAYFFACELLAKATPRIRPRIPRFSKP